MDANKIEQLFLLEVLIDKVVLNALPPETPIRIRVKFIEFPCFEITQQDFKKDEPPDTEGNFNSGKSFLFPMVPLELIRNLQRHPLAVTVFRVTEDAPLLPEIVGQTRVRLSEGMSEAVHSAMSCCCDSELPISHTLTDTFSLRNMGEEVGTVVLFIRLSCFGQSIVTQFQLMGEKKAFLFKNSKADTAFQCKKTAKERKEPEEPTKYDVLPVAPFLTSDENTFDLYSPTGDPQDATVAWKRSPPKPAPCPPCEAPPACRQAPPPCCVCGSTSPPDPITKTCRRCGASVPINTNLTSSPRSAQGSNPPVRYDTTGALSPAFMGSSAPVKVTPPVRYDTTGALSPAFMGAPDSRRASSASSGRGCGKAMFVCPFCGTTTPPRSETRKCSLCGTTRPPDERTQSCTVCGTTCPFFVSKPKECTVCGMICPPAPEPAWSVCDPCPPTPKWTVCNPCPGAAPPPCPPPYSCSCGDLPDPRVSSNLDKKPVYPPVRYDTTGALSPAFMGSPEPPPTLVNPPVRYDTTGALSPAFMGSAESSKSPSNPPVRYDTTGALSPAFMGSAESSNSPSNPPVRYDTTGALSPAFMGWPESAYSPTGTTNPPVRYDTTGALSPAFMGWSVTALDGMEPSPFCKCGGESYGMSPHGSFGQGDGASEGINPHLFLSNPVWQTGSTPAVMEGSQQGSAMGKMPSLNQNVDPDKKHKKKRSKWTHKWGLQYPGIKYGHRQCVSSLPHVPPYMGWLWNRNSTGYKYRKGWRPGAVGPTISKMMNDHRAALGRPLIGAKSKSKWKSGRGNQGDKDGGPQPPTLHIHRREGAYYISMHPLDLGPDAVNVPLQFKIPKREREEGDEDESSSSEESELEIEFMAPGAFEEKKPPPEFKNHGTQFYEEDCPLPKEKAPSAVQLGAPKEKKKGGSKKGGKKGKQRGT